MCAFIFADIFSTDAAEAWRGVANSDWFVGGTSMSVQLNAHLRKSTMGEQKLLDNEHSLW